MSSSTSTLTVPKASHAPPGRQIFGLDLIRFGAACLVMAHHLGFAIWAGNHYAANYHYLGPFTWGGFIGVEIFFVLSGFIIAYSAENATPLGFLENRFIRLYPTAWICSTITVVLLVVFGTDRFGGPLLHRWLQSAIFYPNGSYVDGSYWTLPIEIGFYCVVFVLLVIKRFRLLGVVMSAIGIISTSSLILSSVAPHVLMNTHAFTLRAISFIFRWQAHLLLLDYGCFFAIGSLLWLCLLRKVTLSRILVLLYCFIGSIVEVHAHSIGMLHWYHSNYTLFLPEAIWPLGLASVIAVVYFNNYIGAWLGPKGALFTRRLGLITYPLYLIHQSAGYILIPVFHRFMPDIASLLLTMLLLILASFSIHIFMEKPLQTFLRRLLHPPATPAPPAATLP